VLRAFSFLEFAHAFRTRHICIKIVSATVLPSTEKRLVTSGAHKEEQIVRLIIGFDLPFLSLHIISDFAPICSFVREGRMFREPATARKTAFWENNAASI
jgi:hypothetical protein